MCSNNVALMGCFSVFMIKEQVRSLVDQHDVQQLKAGLLLIWRQFLEVR